MDTKKIVVACGTGGVTSKNIAMKIEKYLKGKGVDAKTSTCRVSEVAALVSQIHPDSSARRRSSPLSTCPRSRRPPS